MHIVLAEIGSEKKRDSIVGVAVNIICELC